MQVPITRWEIWVSSALSNSATVWAKAQRSDQFSAQGVANPSKWPQYTLSNLSNCCHTHSWDYHGHGRRSSTSWLLLWRRGQTPCGNGPLLGGVCHNPHQWPAAPFRWAPFFEITPSRIQTMAEESSGVSSTQPPESQSISRRFRLGRRQTTTRSDEDGGGGASSVADSNTNNHDDDKDEDEEDLPFPGYVKTAYFCLSQTSQPRNYCLRLVTWPYPFCCAMLLLF